MKGEWWLAPTTVRTDAAGRVSVRGFAGDYAIRSGVATDAAPAAFTIARGGDAEASVTI